MTPHKAEPETGGGHNMDQTTVNSTVVPYPTGTAHPGPRPPQAAAVFPITLKFEEVVYKVKVGGGGWWRRSSSPAEKAILNGITGVVCPGEMLAMLGPSGSGKTTLLTALGGRLGGKLSGKITYNGHPFSGAIKRRTGFVAQDDVLYPHLTVTETLNFTALLRLPGTLTRAEKAHQAQQVISELGLSRVAHSMIGGARGVRGVSGGERKRVSIGLELLVDPSLLLLDEPTSGLDSTTAARIVGTLKRLAAEKGRTVVTTIHQPSSRLYRMFDKLVLLSEGSAIYYGRAAAAVDYFAMVGFASPIDGVNPADLLLDLANGIAPESNYASENGDGSGGLQQEKKAVKEALIGAYDRNIATRLKAELCAVDLNNYGYTREMANASKLFRTTSKSLLACKPLSSRGMMSNRLVFDRCSEAGTMVHELVGAVHGVAQQRVEGEEARSFQQAKDLPGAQCRHARRPPVVAHADVPHPRPDSTHLLLLGVLGLLPALQCGVHVPPGAANAEERAGLRHVSPLVLLPGAHRRRPAHGARPPHRLHLHHILDGRPQVRPRRLPALPPRRPVQRPGGAEPRPCSRSHPDGRQAGHHPRLRHHLGLPHGRRLLRPADTALHRLAQVLELQLLLLQASAGGAVLRARRLRMLERSDVPGDRVPGNKVSRTRPYLDRRVHHGAYAGRLSARRLPRTAPPATQMRKKIGSSAADHTQEEDTMSDEQKIILFFQVQNNH